MQTPLSQDSFDSTELALMSTSQIEFANPTLPSDPEFAIAAPRNTASADDLTNQVVALLQSRSGAAVPAVVALEDDASSLGEDVPTGEIVVAGGPAVGRELVSGVDESIGHFRQDSTIGAESQMLTTVRTERIVGMDVSSPDAAAVDAGSEGANRVTAVVLEERVRTMTVLVGASGAQETGREGNDGCARIVEQESSSNTYGEQISGSPGRGGLTLEDVRLTSMEEDGRFTEEQEDPTPAPGVAATECGRLSSLLGGIMAAGGGVLEKGAQLRESAVTAVGDAKEVLGNRADQVGDGLAARCSGNAEFWEKWSLWNNST